VVPVWLNGPKYKAVGPGVSEETEGQDTGAEAVAGGVNPAAVALALGGASREDAGAFLKKQSALIDLQMHHLHEQFKHLHLSVWEKQLGVFLRVATAAVGIAVAAGLSAMVWDAAHSGGLIIEPFAVPSDMAAKGLSGQVVASQMLDKLTIMQDATDSARAPQSYANNWGNNIKVEIPETGVSIGELQRFLKDWLGHDTHIAGEVWRTQTGIAVTAREGGEAGATFIGTENDLDGLMQKAAEHAYSVTQPYRYANFILYQRDTSFADRAVGATAIYRKLLAGPSALEQAWAWNGLGTIESSRDYHLSAYYYGNAIGANPDFTPGYSGLGFDEYFLGRHENSLSNLLEAKRLLDRRSVPDINPSQLSLRRLRNEAYLALEKGDYREALRNFKIGAQAPGFANLGNDQFKSGALDTLAFMHDGGGVRAYLLDLGISSIEKRFGNALALSVDGGLEDWPTILQIEKSTPKSNLQLTYQHFPATVANVSLAHAHLGDLKGAEAIIAQCDADSDDCMIARGQIANLEGQSGRADYWFARVEKAEPSVPFADAAWGQVLLSRRHPDAATAKFTLANQKGPHFADVLEGWGEALMAENQSHLALEKFAQAEKYAPNWGRLHLKWGEALYYSGKRGEAKAQFARTSRLDLTPSEKSELARHP
jgi:tetratricopeptide (TPR) repeat protein